MFFFFKEKHTYMLIAYNLKVDLDIWPNQNSDY